LTTRTRREHSVQRYLSTVPGTFSTSTLGYVRCRGRQYEEGFAGSNPVFGFQIMYVPCLRLSMLLSYRPVNDLFSERSFFAAERGARQCTVCAVGILAGVLRVAPCRSLDAILASSWRTPQRPDRTHAKSRGRKYGASHVCRAAQI
jgi:hypothetical protein